MRAVVAVVTIATLAMAFAFRTSIAGSPLVFWSILLAYVVLAAGAVYKLWDEGLLRERLAPRWGDLSIGVILGALLLIGSWGARALIAPANSPRQTWLFTVYLQLGSSEAIQRSLVLTTIIVVVAVLEEIVWRGLVLDELSRHFGSRRIWPLAALLYAVPMLPTLYTLRDNVAGPNPLLFIAALGCGIVWSFYAAFAKRLPPVIISHAAFTYFSAAVFRIPGL